MEVLAVYAHVGLGSRCNERKVRWKVPVANCDFGRVNRTWYHIVGAEWIGINGVEAKIYVVYIALVAWNICVLVMRGLRSRLSSYRCRCRRGCNWHRFGIDGLSRRYSSGERLRVDA
jgi:hypothetical protein